jgi:hypothetical protein
MEEGTKLRRRRWVISEEDSVFWSDTRERIERGDIVPFIGNSISTQLAFKGNYEQTISRWAEKIDCPWPVWQDVSVAQYSLLREDEISARSSYLRCLKDALLDVAQDDAAVTAKQFDIAQENWEQDAYSFTDLARDLGYLNFDDMPEHPLSVLAMLPFPIYITTSYHRFLETALEKYDRANYRSEIYPWNPGLEDRIEPIFRETPDLRPTDKEPLVYHLYGRDDDPTSLVLTENDYLDFLINVTRDMGMTRVGGQTEGQGLPTVVVNTLIHNSSPLLLGYDVRAWDFRVLFRGLIAAKTAQRQAKGLCIQVPKEDNRGLLDLLGKYLENTSRLKVYKGTPQQCMLELEKIWRGEHD